MRYRADIDGLRAFAIAAVVLFHAGVNGVPGGFVGVDIFFVISGFLITRLIVEHLREGNFSFWDFYARRTRRIYPALFVMIPIVLLLGYFILLPGEYKQLAESALYSSAFLANVYFWLNTGYFDQPANTMPLLHIWSIAVEEQFYLIWPLTLVLIWRFVRLDRQRTLIAVGVATVLLAALCVVLTAYDAKSAFYLPFARLWEFTLGAGVLALPPLRNMRLANALSVLGMLAMLAAVLLFSEELSYPGAYAILPCLGTAAVIAAGEQSLAGRMLSLRPCVFLGKISYSLYLWHWPVIAFFAVYAGSSDLRDSEKFWLIAVAVALAVISWYFIEQPARRRRDHPQRHVAYGAALAACTAAVALIVTTNAGFPNRLPKQLQALGDSEAMQAFECPQKVVQKELGGNRCVVGAKWKKKTAKKALLWGDSHAKHLLPLLDLAGKEQGLSILYVGGCPPFIDNETLQREKLNRPLYSENCAKTRRLVLDWLRETNDIDLVIIADAWAIYPDSLYDGGLLDPSDPATALKLIERGLGATIAEIEPREDRRLLFIGDMPRPNMNVPGCATQSLSPLWRRPCAKFKHHFTNPERASETVIKRLASPENRIYFLDSLAAMCGSPKDCGIQVGDEIIYRDTNHLRHDLSLATRQEIISMLRLDEALSEALAESRHAADADVPQHARE